MSVVAVHIVAQGRVQGVGYRAFVEREAERRNLTGWVRNRRDGTVEAVLQGAAADVAATIEACRRGPFAARVDAIDQREANAADRAAGSPDGAFSVLPTV